MNRAGIFVRHAAELDAFGYFRYINDHNPGAARRFLEAIDRTIESLSAQPLKGRLRKFRGKDLKNIRSWRVDDFENYLIFTASPESDWKFCLSNTEQWIFRRRYGKTKLPAAPRH